MSTPIIPLDLTVLETVTGGSRNSGSNIDSLISQLNSITGSIKDIKNKTKGFGQTEMLMLVMLAAQNRQPSNVVYVAPRKFWW